jgi:flagellar FliL protein
VEAVMSKKVVVILIVVFVILLGCMGTGFFFVWNKLAAVNAQAQPPGGDPALQGKQMKKIGPLHPLETFIVNLADDGGNRYLRVTMNLELKDEKTAEDVVERLPLIRNSILMVLPAKSYEEIHTLEGKNALRQELLDGLNEVMMPDSIHNIYFTEFVVQ